LSQVVFRGVFHRLLTVDTPIGRRVQKQHAKGHNTPLIRVLPGHLIAAGVERLGRTVGVQDGLPLIDDGQFGAGAACGTAKTSRVWLNAPLA
jgi:putative flavoprotein involved in K+ transport